MPKLNFFDSNSHPTLNSKWIGNRKGDSFNGLAKKLQNNGIQGACAVGLPNIGNYSHEVFFKECSNHPLFLPVAALTVTNLDDAIKEIYNIKEIGFKALKIHSRLLNNPYTDDEFVKKRDSYLLEIIKNKNNFQKIIDQTYLENEKNIIHSKEPSSLEKYLKTLHSPIKNLLFF